jgi:hypothetical protein
MNPMISKLTIPTCFSLLACSPLQAALLFSNMGANTNNFVPGVGQGIQITASSYQAYAMGFRTGTTPYVFTDLQLPLLNLSGIANLTISLRQDAGGAGPGAIIERISIDSPLFPDYPQPVRISSLSSSSFPTLAANSVYWITLEPTQIRPCWYSWSVLASVPQPQIEAFSYNPTSTSPAPWNYSYGFQNGAAFAVYGTLVPEPSTCLLSASGVLAAAYTARLKAGRRAKCRARADARVN